MDLRDLLPFLLCLLLLHVTLAQRTLCDSSPVTKDTDTFENSYDFVIIGAGTAGSVLANRLTERQEWNVLLLEAGDDEMCLTDVPIMAPAWMVSNNNWNYKAQRGGACLAFRDERCPWPRGRVMGGTSVINFLFYTRGNAKDYDAWEQAGNPTWGARHVLPYFKKLERTEVAELRDSPSRGHSGYVTVSHVPFRTPLAPAFVAAAPHLGVSVNDPNGEQQIGFSYAQATMKNGRRMSASKAYIRPVKGRRNLHIAKRARVLRILIDPNTKRAYGVQFVKNKKLETVKVSKEVLLSAGTLNSPQLLMLSGIGPREQLQGLNIPIIRDAPGVGQNLQDHVAFGGLSFLVNQSVTISESFVLRNFLNMSLDYLLNNRGPLTMPGGAEALAFLNTRQNNNLDPLEEFPYDDSVPDIELVIGSGAPSGSLAEVALNIAGIKPEITSTTFRGYNGREAYTIVPVVLKPKSRGQVVLRSKNPFKPPIFYHGYYTDESDLRTMVRGIKAAIQVSQAPSMQKFGSTLYTTPFPACAHLPFATDDYWMCAARQMTTNLHHQSGTCKMGPPDDPTAVVDPTLKVYGIEGLRVIDASIMPTLPAAHTNGPVFMIAEKAADMIKQTWQAL